MNKRNVRSFAFGILFAAVLLGASTVFFDAKQSMDIEEAKKTVEKEGYMVVSKKDYEKLVAEQPKEEEKNKVEEQEQGEDKVSPKEEASDEEIEKEEKSEIISYQLEIVSGMNTEEISSTLEKANIIDDEQSFEQFLIEHEYNKKVQVGTFELNNQMSYEEISKIITKS